MAEKVTVGLASHWPCVTDSVVYPPTGSMMTEKEISIEHPTYAPVGHGTLYLFYSEQGQYYCYFCLNMNGK